MKIKVCPKCFNVDKDELEKAADKKDYEVKYGCIDQCSKGKKKKKLKVKYDGKILKFEDQKEFISFIKKK